MGQMLLSQGFLKALSVGFYEKCLRSKAIAFSQQHVYWQRPIRLNGDEAYVQAAFQSFDYQ